MVRQYRSVGAMRSHLGGSAPFRFDQILNQIADVIAQRAADRINAHVQMQDGARVFSPLKDRRLDMRCRSPRCRNRSKGPRFRYLCEEHLRLPKREQAAALQKWKQKKGA